jgi:hypothetical protein
MSLRNLLAPAVIAFSLVLGSCGQLPPESFVTITYLSSGNLAPDKTIAKTVDGRKFFYPLSGLDSCSATTFVPKVRYIYPVDSTLNSLVFPEFVGPFETGGLVDQFLGIRPSQEALIEKSNTEIDKWKIPNEIILSNKADFVRLLIPAIGKGTITHVVFPADTDEQARLSIVAELTAKFPKIEILSDSTMRGMAGLSVISANYCRYTLADQANSSANPLHILVLGALPVTSTPAPPSPPTLPASAAPPAPPKLPASAPPPALPTLPASASAAGQSALPASAPPQANNIKRRPEFDPGNRPVDTPPMGSTSVNPQPGGVSNLLKDLCPPGAQRGCQGFDPTPVNKGDRN